MLFTAFLLLLTTIHLVSYQSKSKCFMLAIVYNFFLAKRVKEKRRLNYEEVGVCFILWIFFGKEVEGVKEFKRDMQVIYCSPLFLFTSLISLPKFYRLDTLFIEIVFCLLHLKRSISSPLNA